MHRLYIPIRGFILVAPPLVVGLLGVTYVYGALLRLSAPGVAVSLKFKTPGGEVTLKSDSYSLNAQTGTLTANRPALYDPQGQLLLKAEYLVAKNLYQAGKVVWVEVSNPELFLKRDSNGAFPQFDLLPKGDDQPSTTAFKVIIRRPKVHYLDNSGTQTLNLVAVAKDVEVSGKGDKWFTNGLAEVEGLGPIKFKANGTGSGSWSANLDTKDLHAEKLLPYLRGQKEFKDAIAPFSASSLTLSARVALGKALDKRFRWGATDVVALGTGMGYEGSLLTKNLTWKGEVSDTGLQGDFDFDEGKARGLVDWSGKEPQYDFDMDASVSETNQLPVFLRKFVPKGISGRQLNAKGRVWGAGQKVAVQLSSSADSVTLFQEKIQSPVVSIAGDANSLAIRLTSGQWRGNPFTASLNMDKGQLRGAIQAEAVDLATAKEYGFRGLSGKAKLVAIVSGTSKKPLASWQARGKAKYQLEGRVFEGPVTAKGAVDGERLVVDQLSFAPVSQALVVANGSLELQSQRLAGNVQFGGLGLKSFEKTMKGVVSGKAFLSGTLKSPKLVGELEAFSPGNDTLTLSTIGSKFEYSGSRARLYDLYALKGSGSVSGEVFYDTRSTQISGNLKASGLEFGLIAPDLEGAGLIDADTIQLSGSIKNPKVTAKARAKQLIVSNIKVDEADVDLAYADKLLKINHGRIKMGEGDATFSGIYDPEKKAGTVDFDAKKIDFGPALRDRIESFTVAGMMTAKGTGSFDSKGVSQGRLEGSLDALKLNGVAMGGGDFEITNKNRIWSGTALVGNLERYYSLSKFNYDEKNLTLDAFGDISGVPLAELINLSQIQRDASEGDWKQRLLSARGIVAGQFEVSGPVKDPNVILKEGSLKKATLDGVSLGEFLLEGSKMGSDYAIRKGSWKFNDANASVTGTFSPEGEVNLDGDVTTFPLSLFNLVSPRFEGVEGDFDLSFSATGKAKTPLVRASVHTNRIGGTGVNDLSLNIDSLSISQQAGIEASGQLTYRGIPAILEAKVPFKYPLELPKDEPIFARVKVATRSLNDLGPFFGNFDAKHTNGTIGGEFEVAGTVDNPVPKGELRVSAKELSFQGSDLVLKPATATLKFQDQKLNLQTYLTSGLGGTFTANLSASIGALDDLIANLSKEGSEATLSLPVTGSGSFDNFKLAQSSPLFGRFAGQIGGEFTVGGNVQRPVIQGNLDLSDVALQYASANTAPSGPSTYLIDPVFDLFVSMSGLNNIRAGIANLDITGTTTIAGNLSRPDISGAFSLNRGTLRFPSARVTLLPQGSLGFRYKAASGFGDDQPISRLDVNLEGKTRLVTSGNGDLPERYEVEMDVTGNLLEDGGLRIGARSDPPGLSQARVLKMLGQGGLVDAFSGNNKVEFNEERLRQTLTAFLPAAFEGVTNKIATNLGLDYLSLDYNPLEQATLSFGRYLSSRWYFDLRRQLSQPLPGQRLLYDFKLIYKTPFKGKNFKRLNLFLGVDQDRPWKLGLEYRLRF